MNKYITDAQAVPTITVTSPNGGEAFSMGFNYPINYTTANFPAGDVQVKVLLYYAGALHSNHGVLYTGTINGNGPWTWTWTVPNDLTPSTEYQIGISIQIGANYYSDKSDGDFSIFKYYDCVNNSCTQVKFEDCDPECYLVSNCNNECGGGGEELAEIHIGTGYNIAVGESKQLIRNCFNSSGNQIICPSPLEWTNNSPGIISLSSNGTVTGLANGKGYVHCKYGGITSNTAEIIVGTGGSGTLNLTYPVGGETWQIGSTYNITWTSTGSINGVLIHLVKGGVWLYVISWWQNNGTYSWTIPSTVTPGNDYQIKISHETDDNISSISDYLTINVGSECQQLTNKFIVG